MKQSQFDVFFHAAEQLFNNKQYSECITSIEQQIGTISNAAHLAKANFLVADAYHELGLDAKAILFYHRSLQADPHNEKLYFHYARSFSELNQHDDEIWIYKTAIQHFPNQFNFYLNLAYVYFYLKKLALAKACYQEMIKIDPKSTMAYRNLGLCFKYQTIENEDRVSIIRLLSAPNLSREDAMHGHFALGKMYQDCNLYEKAFYHIQEANAIHANRHSFKVQEYIYFVDYFINTFNKAFFEQYTFNGSLTTTPIFIIGLSRSGKSLVENVVAINAQIYNADEVAAFEKIAKKTIGKFDVKQYFTEILPLFDHFCQTISK